ncbi:Gfo/Idh/MocA family protein [Paenibacillus protaetiae]|uniref:Gfo/Idh/MocA family oxidoreductase n=1 Tax=Paenibacillus protaetiae TaxID=2509456 RepID=A0A4P6EUZ5_9BACL|nr:Gfo/Idh/MocA family oxidoreductase [Paenibacillus protaetiae]QAY66794.1 Gfo/Idh/MocA family oxidoreductase [Paenibacillus protaetiae]
MVRFGVIGTNKITEQLLEAAKHNKQFKLTAVFSRTEERAKAFADTYGAEHTFTDVKEMAESDVIDAVYIASPTSLHKEYAVICMNGGKHVLCEKPIASNTRELQDMIDAAQRNNVLLMEAMKSTLTPAFEIIRANLDKLGVIRRYTGSYCQYSSRYDAYKQGTVLNAFNPAFSNGALMDLGVYCIYPLIACFGEPNTVKASAVMLESGVDGEGSILLGYNQMEAVIAYSKITSSKLPSEIQGENGTMLIDSISEPGHIRIEYRDGRTEILSEPDSRPVMLHELSHFVELVQSGKTESPVNSFTHSMATLAVMDAARKQIGLVYPADRA